MFDFTSTQPDVLSLEGLLAWLETQLPDKEYCWADSGVCLLARYAASIGSDYSEICDRLGRSVGEFSEDGSGNFELTYIPADFPHTMGAAAARCRAAIASAEGVTG